MRRSGADASTGQTTPGWLLPVAIALLALLYVLRIGHSGTPAPLGADVPPENFSAARAGEELAFLLGDETPHPVGSAANRALKQRLIARLDELGLQTSEQHTIGCSATGPICAPVENVLAEIPGARSDTVLLMAHYDSVEFAPGAGDDGAAVAALLEVARAIAPGAPHGNTILFAFTDAEETGLLGAEALFAEHPAAHRIRAVINLEGSGSDGPVFLLRTGPASGELLKLFRRVSIHPAAQSFTEEVFKRMPNDTDFSVSLRAGLPGIDFAFAGERNNYHTPLDSIANLDRGTLQHHGDNTLPLLRALADADLSITSANEVYAGVGGRLWLYWSPAAGIAMAIAALALLAPASWRARVTPLRLLAASAVALLTPILCAVLAFLLLWLVDRLVGARPAWPANPWPWRIAMHAAPLLVLATLGPWASRRIGAWPVLLGTWWVWGLGTLAMSLLLPLAAYLLIPAAVLAATAMVLATGATRATALLHAGVVTGALLAAAWFLLPLAHLMEVTQGLQLAPAIIVPLGLLALAALPAAGVDRGRVLLGTSAGAIASALLLAAVASPYSAQRPQHLNVYHVQDAAESTAQLIVRSPEVLPEQIAAAAAFRVARMLPWLDQEAPQASVAALPALAPEISAVEHDSAPWRSFHIVPVADSRATALCLPATRISGHARIAGRLVRTASEGDDSSHHCLWFVVPPANGFEVELELVGEEPREAFLLAVSNRLPEAAQAITALRGTLAVPVHSGDRSIVYRRLRI